MTDRWTAETEELVARAINDARHDYADAAGPVLTALADTGLLLPPGGETRRDMGHWSPNKSYVYACGGNDYSVAEHDDSGCESLVSHTCTVTSWPDGSRHYGPWVPVDDGGGA